MNEIKIQIFWWNKPKMLPSNYLMAAWFSRWQLCFNDKTVTKTIPQIFIKIQRTYFKKHKNISYFSLLSESIFINN